MEKQIEVKQVKVKYTCDNCGEGEMLPTGYVLASCPPQYPHTCSNKCGYCKNFKKKYPSIEYVEVP